METDPDAIINRAEQLNLQVEKPSSVKVFRLLIGAKDVKLSSNTTVIKLDGEVIGKWSKTTQGAIKFSLKAGVLNDEKSAELQTIICSFVSG